MERITQALLHIGPHEPRFSRDYVHIWTRRLYRSSWTLYRFPSPAQVEIGPSEPCSAPSLFLPNVPTRRGGIG